MVYFSEPRVTLAGKQYRVDMVAGASPTPTRATDYPVFPRVDSLPPVLSAERRRVISEATLRSTSLSSLASSKRDYPPNSMKFFRGRYHPCHFMC